MVDSIDRDEVTEKSFKIPANTKHNYRVTSRDLPLSCPMSGMELWNSHPRVYLPIEETGEAKCPYCGANFILTDATDLTPAS